MQKRKIAVVTGTRAEYGLLYWLMREIKSDRALELQVIVTGMHLSPEFGLTYRFIEQDGFNIHAKVEMLMSSDTAVGIGQSLGLGVIGFTQALHRLKPDIAVILGDRFEALALAQAALLQKIPLAHIHGGELSEGAIDDAIRHSITKMAHLHFVAADRYRERIVQLGENPSTVFNVGAPGLERIKRTQLLSRSDLEKAIHWPLGRVNFLVTYHPATLSLDENAEDIQKLFSALDDFPQATIIFTKANADEAGRAINAKIDQYVLEHRDRCAVFTTLGDLNYLSLLQYVDVVIGNSSSGLIEVPYFKKPTINIGTRQAKRLRASSILDCPAEKDAIHAAIERALSQDFIATLKNTSSPYREDNSAQKIVKVLKETNVNQLLVKHFYDLEERL